MFRKIILGFTGILAAASVSAQVIEVEGGNVHTYYMDQAMTTDCHMPFKNVTGKATVFAYTQIYSDFPSQWLVSFCDNRNCFPNLVQEDSFASIPKDASSEFKISVVPQGHADTSKVMYTVYDRENPSVKDTVTFNFIVQWGAGLHEKGISRNAVYPNPAQGVLNVANITSATVARIYGSDSRLVKTAELSAVAGEIDIRNLPAGFYFISYTQGSELVRSSFVKQ